MSYPRCAFGASPSRGRRRRTGRAGSAASAWIVATILLPAYAGEGRTPLPVIAPATAGTQCVEPPDVMRRDHMRFLKHQRDDTVHGGVRGAKYSLKACVDCHASRKTASVATAPNDFCVSCHAYAAVRIDCFECHSSKAPEAVAQARP